MKKILPLFFVFFLACAKHMASSDFSVKAEIQPRSGSQVKGTVFFKQISSTEVSITGKVSGLKPNSKHGFHVHEKGDCSATDGSSAGGHFNPMQKTHGAIDAKESHVGDLGNITTDDNGTAEFTIKKKGASLTDPIIGYIGHAVILHDKEDDFTTQPTGNAGSRIGCGVIVKN